MARGGVPFSQRSFHPRAPERMAPKVAGVPMLLFGSGSFRRLLNPVLAIEALDAPRSIDQPLLASVEGMAVRTNLDMKLIDRRTSFEGISACARHYASMVFGMDCSFHLTCPWYRRRGYHPQGNHTIHLVNARRILATTIVLGLLGFLRGVDATAGQSSPRAPTASVASIPAGFAAPGRTDFAPILEFASPGPRRAPRAMAALDRQLIFQHQVLQPEYSPALQQLFDKIPPRNSSLIRAASLYSRVDIPWIELNEAHQLCAEGYPNGEKFYVTTSPSCRNSAEPFRLDAYLALKPSPGIPRTSSSLSSVIASFGGEMRTDTFGFGAIVNVIAQSLTEVYGNLAPPWDAGPGVYNQHDAAARDRFRRDLPTLDDKFHQYFKYDNILDEFAGAGGPYVLFNFAGEVRSEALKKFPALDKFYAEVAPAVTAEVDVLDEKHAYWMRSGFDHGKVWMIFMVRDGKLSGFDAAYHPVGEPLAMASLRRGVTHTQTSIRVRRLGMTFGLDDLSFINYFTRTNSTVSFQSHMEAVPVVVAPPGIQQGVEFVAGEFMRTIAQGSGGMRSETASEALGDGTIRFTSAVTAEFMYSPTLEFLARLADSIADADNSKVRTQERALMREFLDAFIKDYNNARPSILALDRDPALTK
jgi:hypothetical protein